MTNEQILTKAIEEAVTGGWDFWAQVNVDGFEWYVDGGQFDQLSVATLLGGGIFYHHPTSVIYDHEFAKALWGDDEWKPCRTCRREHYDQSDNNDNMRPDHYHLQEMVIADDPIKYLGENT